MPEAHETPSFWPLGQQVKTVAIEPEHLHDVASAATKDEDLAGQGLLGLLFEHHLHLGAQPVEAAPHVGHARRDRDPGAHGKSDHRTQTLEHSANDSRIYIAFKADPYLARHLNVNRPRALTNHLARNAPALQRR
jgi:hypothetical protein